MRRFWIVILLAVICVGAVGLTSRAENTSVKGDYVEVRTASVFAGACHFNGEVTTTGRDALMAWKVTSGTWKGVDLTGVRAIASVSSDENLSNTQAGRRAELIIDKSASHDQAVAILEAIKSRYAEALGEIVSVRTAPISFKHEAHTYDVSSAEASIDVEAMPNDLCCRMPNLVWYSPLVPLGQRKVGYTVKALYAGHTIADNWERAGENSAFYGTFAF
ncbi:MAG: hypothetical protein QOE96_2083 [Blastocatellia bacterium]|jgi:hypothetical protein|nr:hypothetical protein [Blastocatellia bacterium]